jgi:hypothetical protein
MYLIIVIEMMIHIFNNNFWIILKKLVILV